MLNGILNELIDNGAVDHEWVQQHTVGYDELAQVVGPYSPDMVGEICGVPPEDIREAARLLGSSERLVSTVLQGVYQSHQATAAAVQVNNVNLLRGMIGRPGATVFQMNGQPTAENTRETGANGALPGYRNWQNDKHVKQIAEAWNVDVMQIPHWAPPTHAMEIFRQCEANIHWLMLGQVAQALRDKNLLDEVSALHKQALTQIKWLKTRIKESSPQVLVVTD